MKEDNAPDFLVKGKKLLDRRNEIGEEAHELELLGYIRMVCRVCEDDSCEIYTAKGIVPISFGCDDAIFNVEPNEETIKPS
jgi:hypothetical protein